MIILTGFDEMIAKLESMPARVENYSNKALADGARVLAGNARSACASWAGSRASSIQTQGNQVVVGDPVLLFQAVGWTSKSGKKVHPPHPDWFYDAIDASGDDVWDDVAESFGAALESGEGI